MTTHEGWIHEQVTSDREIAYLSFGIEAFLFLAGIRTRFEIGASGVVHRLLDETEW
jgi:hypothetical protein